MKIKKLIIPFTIIVYLIAIRFNNINLYNIVKDNLTKELDIITLSKEFLGKFQFIYFKENDSFVSSDDIVIKLEENLYYVETNTNELINKTDGIVYSIKKEEELYTIKIRCENITITYYNLINPEVSLYQYVKQGECISLINYSYIVKYEN